MFYAYYCATSTPRRNANNCYGPIESNSNGIVGWVRGGEEGRNDGIGSDPVSRRDSGIE